MPKKGRIFISYRREDASGDARSIYQHLERALGKDQLFMDVISIQKGRDFRTALDEHLSDCRIMLAVIGPNWLGAASGPSSLDDDTDFVRMELAAALNRGIPVIPVLVRGASLPKKVVLPTELQPLMFRQSARVSHDQFARDMDGLVDDIRGLLGKSRFGVLPIALTATAVASIAAAALLYSGGGLDRFMPRSDDAARIVTREALNNVPPQQLDSKSYIANLSFLDADSKSVMSAGDAELINQAVEEGMKLLVDVPNQLCISTRESLSDEVRRRVSMAAIETCSGNQKCYIANLTFLDADSKSVMSAGDAEFFNQAVERGMKNLSAEDPKYVINNPDHQLPNNDANAQKLSNIFWDTNLTRTEMYEKIVAELIEPAKIDGLVSGLLQRKKFGLVAVHPFVITRRSVMHTPEMLSVEMLFDNEAVECRPWHVINDPSHQLPNNDANAQKLNDIYWNDNLAKNDKINKIIGKLMEPSRIDGLVSGQFEQHKDGTVSVRPFVFFRQTRSMVTEAKKFNETEFYCTDPNLPGRKVLCDKAREEIRDTVIRLLKQP